MQLDTDHLKGKIQDEAERLESRIDELRREITHLETEKARLSETYEAVEAVERIARELDVLSKLEDASKVDEPPEPSSSSRPLGDAAASYSPKAPSESVVQDFKQWA